MTGRAGQICLKCLPHLKYFFTYYCALLPSFSLEKRNTAALAVTDSQDNAPSASYGLEYTMTDLTDHILPLCREQQPLSQHQSDLFFVFCCRGKLLISTPKRLMVCKYFPSWKQQTSSISGLSIQTASCLLSLTGGGELDSAGITEVSSDSGDALGCLGHPHCDS